MFEKRFAKVEPQLFAANGTDDGLIVIADTSLFKVKQEVILSATAQPNLNDIEVKSVVSNTQMYVGPKSGNILTRSNLTLYTTAANANVFANEQKRPSIPADDHERAVYEEEPVVAKRVILVDSQGDKYTQGNPLPIAFDGTISVGNVTITDDDGDELDINGDGSINVNIVNASASEGLDLFHNEISSVPSGFETTLITLTAPSDGARIFKIDTSGDNVAHFRVKLNGVTIYNKRSWHGDFNQEFIFEEFSRGLLLDSGDILTVTVTHSRPSLGSFEATIMTE